MNSFQSDGNAKPLLSQKTVIVIGKEHFYICKQLMQDNANDDEYASILNIPIEKVRYFKHKMQIFEDKIRAKRRAARLNKRRKRRNRKRPDESMRKMRKKEMTAEERFKNARELILQNYSTSDISRLLKVSERSVTRFRKRLRDQKLQLKAEGKIESNPDSDDEFSFKNLSEEVKIEKLEELFKKKLAATEIAKILKISDRSVRRWRIRLDNRAKGPPQTRTSERSTRGQKSLREEDDGEDEGEQKPKKRCVKKFSKDTVERAKRMLDNGDTNREIGDALGLEVNSVRKLVKEIFNGTEDNLIDDTLETLMRRNKSQVPEVKKEKDGLNIKEERWSDDDFDRGDDFHDNNDDFDDDDDGNDFNEVAKKEPVDEVEATEPNDPLDFVESDLLVEVARPRRPRTKTRSCLGTREMLLVRCLQENKVRTMDIAKLMKISERSVSRLMNKAKKMSVTKYDPEILETVTKLIGIRDAQVQEKEPDPKDEHDAKKKTAMRLISMNVKPKDIMKMLNVSEKTVLRWKSKYEDELKSKMENPEHSVFQHLLTPKEEPIDEEYEGQS